MNDRLQIYVNYFLIVFKMKKISFLFLTFLGICCCRAQEPVMKTDSVKTAESVSAKIYPNPAKNKVEIDINGFEPGYVILQLLNNSGKLIRQERRLVLTGNETIIFMFSESAGLYFLLLKQGVKTFRNKLIIR